MGWAKIDHGFFRNPKVVGISKDAKFLYIGALCYCGEHLTDGVIPAAALRPIGAELDIKNPARAARELVASGLWNARNDAEFEVNDYLDYNESSDERKAKQGAARERMKRNRSQNVRANNERSSQNVREQEEEEEKEVVKHPQTPTGGDGGSNLDDRFDRFWHAYPRKVAKDDARRRWDKIKPSEQLLAEMLAALEWQRESHDWQKDGGNYIPYPASWLNKGQWQDEKPAMPIPLRPEPEDKRSAYMANF